MNPKIFKGIKNPYYGCELVLNRFAKYIDDEKFVKWKYFLNFREKLDLENPQTFNEKLQWLKLYDRHEEYTQMVDKYEVKKYIADLIGNQYIIPTFGVYDSFDEIDFAQLPNQFVLKCTHNSGGIIICRDKASLDIPRARKQMTKWLKKNPFWTNREYPYKNVKPRIIAEQYMEQEDGESLRDYKVLCFNGKAKLIELHRFRYTHKQTQDFYDTEWNKTTISQGGGFVDVSTELFPKPENLDEMIVLSEKICADMIHCRADWYSIRGKLYFGEITFFDGSGLDAFDNMDDDFLLGSWIDLPNNSI